MSGSWTDTVGHACALCGCLVNYVEVEPYGLVSKIAAGGFAENRRRKNGVSAKKLVVLFHERADKRRDVVERETP